MMNLLYLNNAVNAFSITSIKTVLNTVVNTVLNTVVGTDLIHLSINL